MGETERASEREVRSEALEGPANSNGSRKSSFAAVPLAFVLFLVSPSFFDRIF